MLLDSGQSGRPSVGVPGSRFRVPGHELRITVHESRITVHGSGFRFSPRHLDTLGATPPQVPGSESRLHPASPSPRVSASCAPLHPRSPDTPAPMLLDHPPSLCYITPDGFFQQKPSAASSAPDHHLCYHASFRVVEGKVNEIYGKVVAGHPSDHPVHFHRAPVGRVLLLVHPPLPGQHSPRPDCWREDPKLIGSQKIDNIRTFNRTSHGQYRQLPGEFKT